MRLTSAIRETVAAVALAGMMGALLASGALAGPAAVGQVVALSGAVQATAPGQEPRTLACNDWLYEGEVLSTSDGARVGILSGDVYAQLDTSTRLGVATREGAPEFRLVSGAARIVDTRIGSDVGDFLISTPHGSASGRGSDAEVWVVSAGGESHSRICSREAPLQITGAASPLGGTGECAVVTAGGVSPAGSALEPSIGLAGATACATELGGIAARFTPTDVAAPPFGLQDFPDVLAGPASPRDPCDDPAGACGRQPLPPPPPPPPPRPPSSVIAIDQDETPGCGGIGFPCQEQTYETTR